MRPVYKQPSRSYATEKTHKFNLLDEITIENLNFLPNHLQNAHAMQKRFCPVI